jgi:predicted ATPase with chaperone activity
VAKYQKRISGLSLELIDIHIGVPRWEYQKLKSDRLGETSKAIREGVEAARRNQCERFSNIKIANVIAYVVKYVGSFKCSANLMKQVRA